VVALGDCDAICVAAKSVHSPAAQGGGARADEYLERVHVEVAGPMPVKSAGWKETSMQSLDDYTRTMYRVLGQKQ